MQTRALIEEIALMLEEDEQFESNSNLLMEEKYIHIRRADETQCLKSCNTSIF